MTTGGRPTRWRFPLLTAVVFATTAATNLAQFLVPGMLQQWQRSPAGLEGQWWRSVSALFVQDGGVFGTLSNLVFLLAVGALAEQVLSRPRWLLHYFGVGVLAEFVSYAWQPTGAGNSIAICGLAGALAVACWRQRGRVPQAAPLVLMLWCGALLASWQPPLLFVGLVAAMGIQVGIVRGLPVLRPVGVAVLVTAIVLAAVQSNHGAALLSGILLGLLTVPSHGGSGDSPD